MVTKSRFSGGAHEHAAQFVRDAIREGRWNAGEAIDVTALASELGISPSPVREALARLRGEGILSSRFRDGYSLPLLQAHELDGEYRFIRLAGAALTTLVGGRLVLLKPHSSTYAGRMEALLISLAQAADVPIAALRLHQSALRIHSYMSAEPNVLQAAEDDLGEMETMMAGGDGDVGLALDRHLSECIALAPAIARYVFEQSERFESAYE